MLKPYEQGGGGEKLMALYTKHLSRLYAGLPSTPLLELGTHCHSTLATDPTKNMTYIAS